MALDSPMKNDKIKGMTGPKGGKAPSKSAKKSVGKMKGGKY